MACRSGKPIESTKCHGMCKKSALKSSGLHYSRYDWPWFKEAWDQAMVTEHKENWATTFMGWIQGVLDDERSNAFSVFAYNETCRIFKDVAALHVPGSSPQSRNRAPCR